MRHFRVCFALLLGLAATGWVSAQEPPELSTALLARAERLVQAQPTALRWLGLAEMKRATSHPEALTDLLRARDAARTEGRKAGELQELVCWRLLPTSPAQVGRLREEVAGLEKVGTVSAWKSIYWHQIAFRENDRTALLVALAERKGDPLPGTFPTELAEQAHLELLHELGWPRARAALDVIAARNQEPLYTLRDLDRYLTREADFLKGSGQAAPAARLLECRDQLRQAYLRCSRHLVERLFALNLLGRTADRDDLLTRGKKLGYLHDRAQLAAALEKIDEEQAWTKLIQPLLQGEVKLIEAPPDLAALQKKPEVELQVEAKRKIIAGERTRYEGSVRARFGPLQIECERLTVAPTKAGMVLSGDERATLQGVPGYQGGVSADRFVFNSATGEFSLEGDVRLHRSDRTLKYLSCRLTRTGEVRDSRSLLTGFSEAFDLLERLEMLPRITRTFNDAELPNDVRFLQALQLLRPHLTWQAPYAPAPRDREHMMAYAKQAARWRDDNPWQEALGGEEWMYPDIPRALRESVRTARDAWNHAHARGLGDSLKLPSLSAFAWRIRDPKHADVQRAARLLSEIHGEGPLPEKARHWFAEVSRNNTVLTFDIPGAAFKGRNHPIVMDARNADRVAFKLYRVQRPEDLLWATSHIGRDFIYRDHGLQDRDRKLRDIGNDIKGKWARREQRAAEIGESRPPRFAPEDLVQQWEVSVADLKPLTHSRCSCCYESRRWRDWEEPDAHYFDDDCQEYQRRIHKEYRPQFDQFSSWRCDRIVEVPGKALTEVGAYLLVAESNGQQFHVPLLVEPLSLTLRRCRDGVFVLVSDSTGLKPLSGARVDGLGLREPTSTDEQGAAFARMFASGDRAIIAHHQGRFAVGGFGQIFEGIYVSEEDHYRRWYWWDHSRAVDRMQRALQEREAHLYADQHVVAAITDRPTYRPGQEVQFKLIVRKLLPTITDAAASFRARDFDPGKLEMPILTRPVRWTLLDPRGRAVVTETTSLSEFGTAVGKAELNSETLHGNYSLRVHIGGHDRLVPDVFAVKHYRRPTFEVQLAGVPAEAKPGAELTLEVRSEYYFKQPVSSGQVQVRLIRPDRYAPRARQNDTLDKAGVAATMLRLPEKLEAGKYFVVATVTDDSGRIASKSVPVEIKSATPGGSALGALPRFVAVGQPISIATTAAVVEASIEHQRHLFQTVNGTATLKLSNTGWYRVQAGQEVAYVFAHGGDWPPELSLPQPKKPKGAEKKQGEDEDEDEPTGPRWVNLSDFGWEDSGRLSRWENPDHHLLGLFERQHTILGEKLRVLVYVPYQRARLLFTMEGRTVLDYHVVTTPEKAGPYHVIEIPIKERYLPNFYLQGRIIAPEGGLRPARESKPAQEGKAGRKARERWLEEEDDEQHDPRWCRVDVLDPKAPPGSDRLKVQVTTDRPDYRPGQDVQVTLKVTDLSGKPRAAEVSLGAVDESVYSFGEDRVGGLSAFFAAPHEPRRFQPGAWRSSLGKLWTLKEQQLQKDMVKKLDAQAKQAQAMDSLKQSASKNMVGGVQETFGFQRPLALLGGEMPVGSLSLARLRSDFRETATWQPQLRTDKAGVATTSFRLPDTLTRYRLTAVALTKETEIGVGRGQLTAGMPLAVQLILPRFAVEKDRLLAVGLIHNTTAKEQVSQLQWDVQGATADGADGPADLKRVVVPARGTTRVGLWLKLEKVGITTVTLRAGAGQDTDAETRTLPVQPNGREREVTANDRLVFDPAGKPFNLESKFRLPAGFVARDLRLSLACSEIAQSLDGLEYLVDYPYGCIEQTMSRFLPAVMVAHAIKRTPMTVPPDVAAKLPNVLQKGLTRLYGFQHRNGSWGWFDRDEGNEEMTAYVVYGLARCRTTGMLVDPGVLERGCSYLQSRLRQPQPLHIVGARAWHALALAGCADPRELAVWARNSLQQQHPAVARCDLALACRLAGLPELAERLWQSLREWRPEGPDQTALHLNAQVAFGAGWDECRRSAGALLAQRQGQRWYHTRATSWALEALTQLFPYVPARVGVRRVQVWAGDKLVLTVSDPLELKKLVYRLHLPQERLSGEDGLFLRLVADSDEPVSFSLRAVGTQRVDQLEASGDQVKVLRSVERLNGQVVKGPVGIGEVIRVRLHFELTRPDSHLIVEDRRPAGFEYADERLEGPMAAKAAHVEFRDDRVSFFFTRLEAGKFEVAYYLRAETAGVSHVLPGCIYPMYDEKTRGETGPLRLEVR